MDICVAIGVGILGKIFEYTVAPVGRQVGYLFCYTSNVDKLRTQVQKLKYAKDSLQHRINEDRRNGKEIETHVVDWMSRAESTLEEVETFLKDGGHKKARLSCGSSPSLVSRHQLSRRAKKMTAQIATDVESSEKFSTISYRPQIESGIGLFKGYQAFETRNEALKRVMEVLRDPTVRMVALYGMGGVGKTVLAKEVMRLSKEENLFSKMVITSVSQTVNIKNIQQEIADHLGLKFDQVESTTTRADMLRNRLKQEKKFLLVLDDIWNKIELFDIGIHFEDDPRGCKILLTSRIRDVVRIHMDVENSISLDRLSDYEAEGLFRETVGNIAEQSNFQDLARQLVKECAGLPIAIMTLASALKDKKKPIWENALRQLQSHNPENIEGMPKQVYSSIRLSYDFLDSEEAKSLLLLCSLHREDENIKMDDLVKCVACWDLFDDIRTLEDARNLVNSLVNTLKSRCLLLDGDDYETVKMHYIIRDVSIWIASIERNIYSLSDLSKLENLLNKRILKDSKAISVLDIGFGKPPQKLECKHLELLLMHCNDQLEWTIPEHFFKETQELKVFILNGSSEITLQLSSFHFPNNLRSLCLRSSKLQDVGLIGDLKNLNILDLSDSDIYQLPKEFGQLKQLKLLDLRGCDNLKLIGPNVLSSLTKLEELYLPSNFNYWKAGEVSTDRRNSNLAELMNLKKLTSLFLSIPDAKILPKGFIFSRLKRYRIGIGSHYDNQFEETSKSLVLRDCEESRLKEHGIEALMRRSERLKLGGFVGGVKNNVVYDLDKEGFPELKSLTLNDCSEVQYVANMLESPIFIKLESLHLEKLENLEEICHGTLTPDSFRKLREVTVEKCGKLKNLFPSSIAVRLHRIEVKECEMMEGIVGCDQREDEIAFSELRDLTLRYLPKLVEFMISRPQLGATTASSSAKSFNYPLFGEKKIVFPSLENVNLTGLNITALWEDRLSLSTCMPNLKKLTLSICNNLKYVLSSTVCTTLLQLESLEILSCEDLEEVVAITEEAAEIKANVSLVFPKLKSLSFRDLSKLKQFCKGDITVEFPLLSKLNIDDCCEMRVFIADHPAFNQNQLEEITLLDDKQPFLSNKKIVFPNLENVALNVLNITALWEDRISLPTYMPNLKELTLSRCKNLKYVLSSTVCTTLLLLESLSIRSCEDLKEVVAITEEPAGSKANVSLLFPKLKSLFLNNLPKLKHFCKGDSAEFPLLSELTIYDCCEMRVFIVDHPAFNQNQLEEMTMLDYKQPLFSNKKIVFPSLENVDLNGLNITALWEDRLSQPTCMPNLKCLRLNECKNMKYVLSSTVYTTLLQLENLVIWFCEDLEKVVEITEEAAEIKANVSLVFPKLKYFNLNNLPKLKQFCKGDITIEFPLLSELSIYSCYEEMTLHDYKQPLFSSKNIVFPSLKNVDLRGLNIMALWKDRLSPFTFLTNLKDVRLNECENLKYVLSSSVYTTLKQLESLWISSCEDLEEVVAITEEAIEIKANVSLVFPKLNSLYFYNLPKLRQFYKGDSVKFPLLSELTIYHCCEMSVFLADHASFNQNQLEEMTMLDYKQPLFSNKTCFPRLEKVYLKGLNITTLWEDILSLPTCMPNLKDLRLFGCKNLKYVLSSSVFTTLSNLESLWIESCEDLEEVLKITEEPAGSKANISLLFTKLKSLNLKNLPKVKQFCKGDITVEFPLLSELKLLDYQQPLFSHKVAFPNLLCVTTDSNNEVIKDIFGRSQLPYCNLKELDVNYIAQDEPISLSIFEMLHRYQNLEKLELSGCFMNVQTSSSHSQSLSQPLMSFHNLTILKVSECNDLTYLLDSSTARGLSQLKKMWIWSCRQMKDIIIRDCKECETTEDNAFHFKRLEALVLCDLPNLKSFFSGNNAIIFPRLKNLFVIKCPKMKSFCDGIITTFILSTIITEIEEEHEKWMDIYDIKPNAKRECWDGDVNTTIRKLWEESSNSLIQQSLTNTDVGEFSGEFGMFDGIAFTCRLPQM